MRSVPKEIADLAGKRVVVMGLGTKGGGTGVVKWLVRQKSRVLVTDLKPARELHPALNELHGLLVEYVFGAHREEDFRSSDLVIRNPAVPLESPYLRIAEQHGVPWVMDVTLFFLFCPAPIAGVTGTRGKSTTTAVAGEILKRERPETVVAGNIGLSPLEALDRITPSTPVVLELSSWQLEGLAPFRLSPHWSLLTTIQPDHLNRYSSMEDYAAAKASIVRFQKPDDTAILPVDDVWGGRFARDARATVKWFGVTSAPAGAAGAGLFKIGDQVVMQDGGTETTVVPWAAVGGTGDHTKRNMVAGAFLSLEMGASLDAVRTVLRSFRGLPNRLEVIRELAGRSFVNDTTATTPEAVMAALRAYVDRRVVLITGGTDKNLDYGELAHEISGAGILRSVVFLRGSATEKLLRALGPRGEGISSAGQVRTMAEAVDCAWRASTPGDVILLSPGAASFELFRDEFDRGDQFRRAVSELEIRSSESMLTPGASAA